MHSDLMSPTLPGDDWHSQAGLLLDRLKSMRSKKTNGRGFNRMLKDANYSLLSDCVTYQDIVTLMTREDCPDKKTDVIAKELGLALEEADALRQKFNSEAIHDLNDLKARELLSESINLKVDNMA